MPIVALVFENGRVSDDDIGGCFGFAGRSGASGSLQAMASGNAGVPVKFRYLIGSELSNNASDDNQTRLKASVDYWRGLIDSKSGWSKYMVESNLDSLVVEGEPLELGALWFDFDMTQPGHVVIASASAFRIGLNHNYNASLCNAVARAVNAGCSYKMALAVMYPFVSGGNRSVVSNGSMYNMPHRLSNGNDGQTLSKVNGRVVIPRGNFNTSVEHTAHLGDEEFLSPLTPSGLTEFLLDTHELDVPDHSRVTKDTRPYNQSFEYSQRLITTSVTGDVNGSDLKFHQYVKERFLRPTILPSAVTVGVNSGGFGSSLPTEVESLVPTSSFLIGVACQLQDEYEAFGGIPGFNV